MRNLASIIFNIFTYLICPMYITKLSLPSPLTHRDGFLTSFEDQSPVLVLGAFLKSPSLGLCFHLALRYRALRPCTRLPSFMGTSLTPWVLKSCTKLPPHAKALLIMLGLQTALSCRCPLHPTFVSTSCHQTPSLPSLCSDNPLHR